MKPVLLDARLTRRDLGERAVAALAVGAIPAVVDLSAPRPAGAVALSGMSATVSSYDGFLNLRTGPSASYSIIRPLYNGTVVYPIDTSGDWFKVTTGGTTGWVNSWYVVLQGTPSQVISRGNTNRKMVALTFDAGADRGYATQILNTLSQNGIPASFSLTGAWMQSYPTDARVVVAKGHQILNHTLDHPSFTGLSTGAGAISPAQRVAQLVANEDRLDAIAGAAAKPYWRPPYGDHDSGVLRDVGAAGYGKTIMWGIDTMGWNGASADQIHNTVVNRVGWGTIVLMHVGAGSQDANALGRIITTLRGRGYGFGTIRQVIAP